MPTACPVDPALSEFVAGDLSPDESTHISEHVRDCLRCAARVRVLERLAPEADSLLGDLRDAGDADPPADAEFEAAVQTLLTMPVGRGFQPGDVIDDYRLVELLGEGGMGVVFRAVHTRLEMAVALKVIRRTRTVHSQTADRFRREMKAAGKLFQENLVRATDAGVADGVQYLVTEYVPGTDLARVVARDGPFPLGRACDIARQAAAGLHHAHRHGLVHRDVKPSNLLLGDDGVVRVLDLGLALLPDEADPDRVTDSESTAAGGDALTSPGQQLGTRNYAAPEQLADSHGVDHRADIYGLGCTLVYLLAGRPPKAGTPHPAGLPVDLWEKFLAADPAGRFPSMAAAAEALAPFCGPVPRPRRRWLVPAAAVVVAATLGIVAIFATNAPVPVPAPVALPPSPPAAPPRGLLPMTADEAVTLQNQWADHLGQPAVVTNSLGADMVLIPPGEFGLYSTYQVTLTKSFRMASREVTHGEFRAFVGANPGFKTGAESKPKEIAATFVTFRPRAEFPHPRGRPVNWRAPGWGEYREDQPIAYLTWDDAAAFLAWLSAKEGRTYRLPTHAEWAWAWACRAGAATRFYWGTDVKTIGTYAWTRLADVDRPQAVGRLRANAWGLHDVIGNVAEMVQDYHAMPLPAGRATDPVNATAGGERIACGGDYNGRVGYSIDTLPASAVGVKFVSSTLGFRVVLEP